MGVSVLERRLQLLLDHDRYERVAAEAKQSGRSAAAVIREAIDQRFPSGREERAIAMKRFLQLAPTSGHGQSAEEIVAELHAAFEERVGS